MSAEIAFPGGSGPLSDDQLLAAYAWDEETPGRQRPVFRFNFVVSADGAAAVDGRSGGLGDDADRRVFALLRRTCDAVLVGAGTVRTEGYAGDLVGAGTRAWRAERNMQPHPGLVIVSGTLDLDPDSPLFSQAPVRPLLLTAAIAPPGRRKALEKVADVAVAGARTVEPDQAARVLAERGFDRVLCEGGPHLFGAFQAAGLVDGLCLTLSAVTTAGTAPRITAGAPEMTPRPLELAHVLRSGDTLLLRYRSPGPASG
ncbi:pyrimidine reductase family protein [Arthrobacter sp. Sa2BUA2]|uniref:Pyrimidine reductase family protein n=1 Tax=Arthrobacter pullicola TaxID=2762224 RepID=A0ABR8YI37_9MICC|nr:pyrimidine reductase family protein [Arthrobacter pullicola]MBD8043793.1 pyrimidine reductase family protein [Arthrobacter pullicola]